MSDDWAEKRADKLWLTLRFDEAWDKPRLAAALREEREHGLRALRLAHAMQEKAVAAERERILARLREPDEGLVEAVTAAVFHLSEQERVASGSPRPADKWDDIHETAKVQYRAYTITVSRALAAHLETETGPSHG